MRVGQMIDEQRQKEQGQIRLNFNANVEVVAALKGIAKATGLPNSQLYRHAMELGKDQIEAEYADLERKQ